MSEIAPVSTVAMIYRYLENNQDTRPRPHLGASEIGHECSRHLWYSFRWAKYKVFDGRMLRLLETGNLNEDYITGLLRDSIGEKKRLIDHLVSIGVRVITINPKTGKQYSFSDIGGHFGASMDGGGKGFIESPNKWHVLEFKTSKRSIWNSLQKHKVEKAIFKHYVQMQIYMKFTGMDRAFYFSTNKDTDDIHGERVKENKTVQKQYFERARLVIESTVPQVKVSQKRDHFVCNLCDHQAICHDNELPEINCRTCIHASPITTGEGAKWKCSFIKSEIDYNAQLAACPEHLYIPQFLPFATVIDSSPDLNCLIYKCGEAVFVNGNPERISRYTKVSHDDFELFQYPILSSKQIKEIGHKGLAHQALSELVNICNINNGVTYSDL